MFYSLL